MASVIREDMDKVAHERETHLKEKQQKGEKLYPTFDGNTWVREGVEEIETPMKGDVKGEIPKWLNGVLIRNGPGKFTFGNDTSGHLFDGQAALHKFQVKDGEVTYQRKFIKSNAFKANTEANRFVYSEFGTLSSPDPCHSIFQRFSSIFRSEKPTDNANISVYPIADEIYAYGEFPAIFKIDRDNLETEKRVNAFKLFNIIHHTSHPLVEEDGSIYNIGLSISKTGAKYCVVTFPKAKKGEKAEGDDVFKEACIKAEVSSRWPFHPGYMHSFGLTENYYVIIEQPYCISGTPKLPFTRKTPLESLKWFENEKTMFHVVSRETGKVVRSFSSEGFFYFHTINQFEEDNQVVLDMCVYRDGRFVNALCTNALKGAQSDLSYGKKVRARAVRFVLPLGEIDKTGANMVTLKESKAKATATTKGKIQLEAEFLTDFECEMPRVNGPKYTGKKYKYFYCTSFSANENQPGGLLKVDTESKTAKLWKGGYVLASEPVFVASPDAKEEDDGVVLSTILYHGEGEDKKTSLVVLDAKNFTELGRADFDTPTPNPFTFHGWFFNDS